MIDDPETNINPADIQAFYTSLWNTDPEIAIAFGQSGFFI